MCIQYILTLWKSWAEIRWSRWFRAHLGHADEDWHFCIHRSHQCHLLIGITGLRIFLTVKQECLHDIASLLISSGFRVFCSTMAR